MTWLIIVTISGFVRTVQFDTEAACERASQRIEEVEVTYGAFRKVAYTICEKSQ